MSVPYVIEKGPNNQERVYDLFSRLLKDRIISIHGIFSDNMADTVVAQLLFLESDSSTKDIYMYINSPGGAVNSMYSIFDTINNFRYNLISFSRYAAIIPVKNNSLILIQNYTRVSPLSITVFFSWWKQLLF